jgi:hypothetical protein
MTAEAQSTPSSRRAVIAAGIGGVLALIAQALSRPGAVRATNGDAVKAGQNTDATANTSVTTTGGNGLQGNSADSGGSGVYGENSNGGHGVAGRVFGGSGGIAVLADAGDYRATGATGLWAKGGAGSGSVAVRAIAYGSVAVEAQNTGDLTAVLGYSGSDTVPDTPEKTGVYGYAAQDNTAVGVMGGSDPGIGVKGWSTSSTGVRGDSTHGAGVGGVSDDGAGVAGVSNGAQAVVGTSSAAAYPAILGRSRASNTGVQGFSGGASDTPPAAPSKAGVYGYANQDANATGVFGASAQGTGVRGTSNTQPGVSGSSSSSIGVNGSSNSGPGVNGFSNSGPGVSGQSATGTGVWASSGSTPPPPAKTGVYGYAAQDASARGVVGQSAAGRGVHGLASSGVGVRAEATTTSGFALDVIGRARFSRSGKLAIAAGRSSVTKTAIPVTSSSLVIAVLQTNRAGVFVRAAVVNPTARSFTIYLNKAVTATTYVAWFVLG